MGFYTVRSKKWELINISIILGFLFIPYFRWFFIFCYMGVRVKKINWIFLSIVATWLEYFLDQESFLRENLLPFFRLSMLIVTFIYLKEFLKRLDLDSKTVIHWNTNYDYGSEIKRLYHSGINAPRYKLFSDKIGYNFKRKDHSIIESIIKDIKKEDNSISSKRYNEKSSADEVYNNGAFISELKILKEKIHNDNIKKNIQEIIRIFTLLNSKYPDKLDIITVRHSDYITKFLKKYDELEETRLDNSSLKDAEMKLENIIETSTKAITNELVKLYSTDLMQIDAEMEAYLENIKRNNLIK